jgi:hypothetical protein
MAFVKFILNLDRRVIFVIVALLVAIPLLWPLKLPIQTTPEVRGIFDEVDKLGPNDHILISGDFDPASKPELYPMFKALLAHCFERGIKVHVLTLWPAGPALLQTAIEEQAAKYNKVSGTDFVFLGYKPGGVAVILGLEKSIPGTFSTDHYGKPTAPMPIYQNASKTADMNFLIDVAAGATVEWWIAYAAERTGVPMGTSCTAVSATGYYPYLNAGQIKGLAGGMKGSAEYETLLEQTYKVPVGDATKGMDAQSAIHIFIVLSIIVANICFFINSRNERLQRRSA